MLRDRRIWRLPAHCEAWDNRSHVSDAQEPSSVPGTAASTGKRTNHEADYYRRSRPSSINSRQTNPISAARSTRSGFAAMIDCSFRSRRQPLIAFSRPIAAAASTPCSTVDQLTDVVLLRERGEPPLLGAQTPGGRGRGSPRRTGRGANWRGCRRSSCALETLPRRRRRS